MITRRRRWKEEYSFIKSLTERNDIQSRQGNCHAGQHCKVDIYTWIYTHKALRHGSHSFTCKLHHACIDSPAAEHHRPLAGTHFTVPRRVEGWVDLGCWLHTEIKYRLRESNPDTVTHPSTNRARRRVTSLIRPTPLPLRHAATPWCMLCPVLQQLKVNWNANHPRLRVTTGPPGTQPSVSKHWRKHEALTLTNGLILSLSTTKILSEGALYTLWC